MKIEHKYIVALIYVCILFVDRMDVSILNVALPDIAESLHVQIMNTEWLSTAYLMALSISILASKWLGDRFGLKNIFIAANILVLLGSAVSPFIRTFEQLVILRVILGAAGGTLIPVGMTMTYQEFKPQEYSKLASSTLIPSLVAPAIGPSLGGLIVHFSSWRYIFLVHIPTSFLALGMAFYFLKPTKTNPLAHLDTPGLVLTSLSVFFIIFGLSHVANGGVETINSLIFCFFGLISIIFLVKWSLFTKNPLVDLRLFKVKLFLKANILQVFLQICYFGSLFLFSLFLQTKLHFKPLETGLMLFFQPFGTILMMPFTAKLFNKFGPRFLVFFGMLGLILTSISLWQVGELVRQTSTLMLIICVTLFLRGMSIGLVNVTVQTLAMLDVSALQTGSAAALLNALRQFSITLGVASSALCLKLQKNSAYSYAFLWISFAAFIGLCLAFSLNNEQIKKKVFKN